MRLSIGICACDEAQNIGQLIQNIVVQPLPGSCKLAEVIVVASGCTDDTERIVECFSKLDRRIRLISENKRNGKASALNKIFSAFDGDLLLLLPADVLPAMGSIQILVDTLVSDEGVGVVCGRPVPVNDDQGFMGYLVHLIWRLHHRTLKLLCDLAQNTHATGELMILKKRLITKIPSNVVNDDSYISMQIWRKGLSVKYCPESVVFIKAPETITDYVRQRRRIVYGHRLTKKFVGSSPTTLESMMLNKPSRSLNVIKQELHERYREIPKFVLALFVEMFVYALAILDDVRKPYCEYVLWPLARSTKYLGTQKITLGASVVPSETRGPFLRIQQATRRLTRIRASEVLLVLAAYFRFWRLVQTPDLFVDEAYYLEISSNFASQGGLVFQNSPWFVHPPFFYLVEGSLLKLLNLKGVTMDTIFLGRAIAATFSIMTLLMVYIWLSRSDFFDHRTGAFVAFLTTLFLAFEPYTLKYARIGIIEHVAIFSIVGSVIFFYKAEVSLRKSYSMLSGIFWGLALLTKELSIFLVFVYILFLLFCYLFLGKKTPKREAFKRFLICASVAFLIYSLYVGWAFSVDGGLFLETKTYLLKRIFHMVPDTGYTNPRYPPILIDVVDVMNVYIMTYLLLLLAAVSCIYVLRRERSSLSVLLVSWFIGTLSFFPLIGVVNPQFFVYIIVPAGLVVGTVIGKSLMKLRWSAHGIKRRGISWYLIVSLLLGMFAYNIVTNYILYDAGDDNAFLQSVNWIKSNITKDRRIMAVYEYSYFLEGYDLISFGLDMSTVVQENVTYVIVSARSLYIFDQNLLDYLSSNGRIVKSFYGRSARYIDIYEIDPARSG